MKVKLCRLIGATSIGLLMSYSALGAQGVVTEKQQGCNYLVVKVDSEYAVLEWNSGREPKRGDQLKGRFGEGYMGHLDNVTTGDKVKLWFENYPVSKEEASRLYNSYVQSSCKK